VTGNVVKAEPLGELNSSVNLAGFIRRGAKGGAVARNAGQGGGVSNSAAISRPSRVRSLAFTPRWWALPRR
jgi:hypothetical protein